MAVPVITNASDPIVRMVRDYSAVLASVSTSDILTSLNQHAFPRIRGRLMTAHDGAGNYLFYSTLADLASPTLQAQAEALVTSVMTDSTVSDYIRRIASALSASWLLNRDTAAVINTIQNHGHVLEKQALADLDFLIKSPELRGAIASTKTALADTNLKTRLYLALEIDPNTANLTTNTAKTYAGAQENGIARMWLYTQSIQVNVAFGETPAVIINRLLGALRTVQLSNPNLMNLVFGVNEGPLASYLRSLTITDLMNNTTTALMSVDTHLSYMEFHAHAYDALIDANFVTLELLHFDNTVAAFVPGIQGLVYGATTNDQPDYNQLTKDGPWSAIVDMTTGRATAATSPGNPNGVQFDTDAFHFRIPDLVDPTLDTVLAGAGVLRYRIQNWESKQGRGIHNPDPNGIIRVVPFEVGASALDLVLKLADDLLEHASEQRVLGGIRSPAPVTVSGTTVVAPSIRMIPYRYSDTDVRVIVDILEVPQGVIFGVLPQALATTGTFDASAKSLVLTKKFNFERNKFTSESGGTSIQAGDTATTRTVIPKLTKSQRLLSDLDRFGFGGPII